MQGDAQRAIVVLGNSVVRKRGGVVLERILEKGDEVYLSYFKRLVRNGAVWGSGAGLLEFVLSAGGFQGF